MFISKCIRLFLMMFNEVFKIENDLVQIFKESFRKFEF